jgi:hypothetical protein
MALQAQTILRDQEAPILGGLLTSRAMSGFPPVVALRKRGEAVTALWMIRSDVV